MTNLSGSEAQRVTESDLPQSPFLADWVFTHAERTADAPAIASPMARLTYREVADRVRDLAGYLASTGVGMHSRVLVALPNTPATVVAGLALNALGAISLEISREWSAEMIADVVGRGGVRQLFVDGRDTRMWQSVLAQRKVDRVWVVQGQPLAAAVSGSFGGAAVARVQPDGQVDSDLAPSTAPLPTLDPDQTAIVLYTSGSLGRPAGVVQTFGNIDANSRSIVEYLGLGPSDRAMLTLPLSYCYGRSVMQTHLLTGGSIFLDHRMAFPRVVLEAIGEEGCTGFAGVPTTFEVIRRQVDVSTITFPRLRYLTQAGGAMAPDTVEWVRAAFDPARLFVMYGQTEATARLSYLPPERAAEKPGSIGIAIPGVELRVLGGDGEEVPPGTVGELVARGANVTSGYLDDSEGTAEILRDGWLWTGDLVERDRDGYLYHRGRSRNLLKVGGHRVDPAEIEHIVMQHSDVDEVVVIGAADALLGEVPIAIVVLREGAAADEAGQLRFCRERLPANRVPTRMVVVSSIPRNPAGKPLRKEIAQRYAASNQRQGDR